MGSLYREVLKKALSLSWRYRWLWFFGLFVAFLGNSGEYGLLIQGFNRSTVPGSTFPYLQGLGEIGFFQFSTLGNFFKFFWTDPFSIFLALLIGTIILLIIFLIIWLVIVSQAALIEEVAKVSKANNRKVSISQGIKAGWKNFVNVLGLNIIAKILIYILLMIVGLPVIYSIIKGSAGWQFVAYFISFLIFVPLAIIISFITKYAIAYAVLKKHKFLDSLFAGWQLFLKNWLISLEMAFILFVINLAVSLVLLLATIIIAWPFILLGSIFYLSGSVLGFGLVPFLAVTIITLMLIWARSVLATFIWSSWTLLFVKLTKGEGVSKIIRLSDSLYNYVVKK